MKLFLSFCTLLIFASSAGAQSWIDSAKNRLFEVASFHTWFINKLLEISQRFGQTSVSFQPYWETGDILYEFEVNLDEVLSPLSEEVNVIEGDISSEKNDKEGSYESQGEKKDSMETGLEKLFKKLQSITHGQNSFPHPSPHPVLTKPWEHENISEKFKELVTEKPNEKSVMNVGETFDTTNYGTTIQHEEPTFTTKPQETISEIPHPASQIPKDESIHEEIFTTEPSFLEEMQASKLHAILESTLPEAEIGVTESTDPDKSEAIPSIPNETSITFEASTQIVESTRPSLVNITNDGIKKPDN